MRSPDHTPCNFRHWESLANALLLSPPGLDYLVAFFGCLYAKAIAVPLYPSKLKRNLAKISAIAKDGGATVAIAPARHLENLEQLYQQAPELTAMRWLRD